MRHDGFAGHAEQQETLDDVSGGILIVDIDHVMTLLEFLGGGDLGEHAFAAAGLAVQIVDRATVEEALAVLALEHGWRGRQFNAGRQLGEVFEPPTGRGFICLVTFR